MIWLISGQGRIETNEIKICSVQYCLDYFKDKTEIGFDIETHGFDIYSHKVICIQLGDYGNQFVVDLATIDIQQFKPLLEDTNKIFLGHNIKFDIGFMLVAKIIIKNVYDTLVSDQIIWNGYENMRFSLDYVCERYTGVFLDKSIRGNIHKEGLSNRVIKYAADDTKYLFPIKEAQLERAKRYNLQNSIKLNNLFVPVIAYLEYCGFKLDSNKWQEKINKDKQELNDKLKLLNQIVIKNNITQFIDRQTDLFNPEIKTNINWASPKQVIKLFKLLGIDTSIIDKETGELKNSVNSKVIGKKVNEHEIVKIYIEYREDLKKCSTYGENWFKFINPVTKRIHTKFRQFISTGRMSSGGKDKANKFEWPNAQNIPADEMTRSCIVADEGNILIDSDYDSQEVRVFANWCLDPALLKMFDEGYTDMHSYSAWQIYPEIRAKYPELTLETIKLVKKDFPALRQITKLGNFAIQYGGTGYTVAENCNISQAEGEEFYNNYFKAFAGVKTYFADCYQRAKQLGYIEYNTISREKFFIPKDLKDGKIKNYSYNYRIQGSSACITKLAGIYYYRHLLEADLLFKCKIAIICHDEYLIEVPKELAEQEAKVLKDCMERAGDFYCKRIKLTATPAITDHWAH